MSTTLDAFFLSWPSSPWLALSLVLTAVIYFRGWRRLHRHSSSRWPVQQMLFFIAGLVTLFLALASPIEAFSSLLLQLHMVQHLLLMMAVPPLLWLGAPLFPMLLGLPRSIRSVWVVPLFHSRVLRRTFENLTHPTVALPLFVIATWVWHIPAMYELALRSDSWHYLQHLCFLGTGLLFWYPLVRPYPARPRWHPWLLIPYLILADLQNTLLSALLTFSGEPLYPHYSLIPRLGGITPLADQAAAGVIMWVPGSLAFLIPLFWIGVRLLFGDMENPTTAQTSPDGTVTVSGSPRARMSLPLVTSSSSLKQLPRPPRPGFDVLRIPILGSFLRWRYARLALQIPLLILAGLLIHDGLTGPAAAPMNLAGILPWIHWRGLLILGLLVAGNLFCMACPFLVPRTLARWLFPATHAWPRFLRSKWLAVLLVVLFLWAYEAYSLWDSPWVTAWIALAYFLAAFLVDGLFRGASFCKYLCPIGQMNFVQSLVSPLEIQVRDSALCQTCQGKECIRGSSTVPGCELHLYQPRKVGNMDCTFCLDCMHACPHDNIGILTRPPASELWDDPHRSGIGRFSRRPDLAALVLVLVFGAFANAAGMTAPVVQALGGSSYLAVSLFYLVALIVLPLLLASLSATLGKRWAQLPGSTTTTATQYIFSLIPLGFAMWLAHYCFHFLTSYSSLIPVFQRYLFDLGFVTLGLPDWAFCCCAPVAGWLIRLEILFLDLGYLLSLYTAYRISASLPTRARTVKAWLPWAFLLTLLFAAGIWILFQPMQMRGTQAALPSTFME